MSVWIALAARAATSAPPALLDGALGANFNEHYEDGDFAELRRANHQWVRGFLTMPQVDPQRGDEEDPGETVNMAERYPDRTEAMLARLDTIPKSDRARPA